MRACLASCVLVQLQRNVCASAIVTECECFFLYTLRTTRPPPPPLHPPNTHTQVLFLYFKRQCEPLTQELGLHPIYTQAKKLSNRISYEVNTDWSVKLLTLCTITFVGIFDILQLFEYLARSLHAD